MEDGRLLAGEGQYVGNVALPGMLHMKVVRSPHAHALIRSIDVSGAVTVPGVVAVHTGRDLVDDLTPMPSAHLPGLLTPEHHALATQRVRLVGDPVAVVVATSLSVAADAADLVEVDYEPRPAVVDPEAAVAPGAPLVHDEFGTNTAFVLDLGGRTARFPGADVVVRQRMVNQRLIPNPMEPRGVVADYRRFDGTLWLQLSTQAPHIVRSVLAGVLDIAENKIRIVTGDVGGAFGAKLNIYPEDVLAAVLSRKHGRSGEMDRAAQRVDGRDQPRPGAHRGSGGGGDLRWVHHRTARQRPVRHWRLLRAHSSVRRPPHVPDDLRLLPDPADHLRFQGGLHEQDAGGAVPRLLPGRGQLLHRARRGPGGGRAQHRPGRDPPPQLHRCRAVPIPHRHRGAVRQR